MTKAPIRALLMLALVAGLAGAAQAVSTRQFSLDSAGVLSAGKLEGTAVLSTGAVIPSVETRRLDLQNVGIARSLLVLPDGKALVGTGNDGKVFIVVGDDVKELADTGELLVTSLVQGPGGRVYAGTLPAGKIFEIDARARPRPQVAAPADAKKADTKKVDDKKDDSKKDEVWNAKLFAEPKDAEHIWDLLYDAGNKTLFAATGPEGQVFAIDAKGKAEVYYDSDASHVMSLAGGGKDTLYAGTSDDALLLALTGPGRADVVYDFEGNEITSLSVQDGRIAVAANLFPKAPAAKKPTKKKNGAKDQDDKKSDDKTKAKAATSRPKPGKGELWVVAPSGRARKLWASSEGHITALQWTGDEAIYAATGKAGHIHRVQQDGTHALWIDVDERQVLAMDLTRRDPIFVTGDAGAIYRVMPGEAREARWTSKVLDAGFRSRWGELTWRGRGGLSFQTRAGNTEKPDESWSEWSSVLTRPGPVRSPAARFLQVRARLATGRKAGDVQLYAVQAYYLPTNQSPTVQQVTVQPKKPKGKAKPRATSTYKIEWKVDNPDKDRLRYRLHYRPEGRARGREILRETEILTKTSHEWDTLGVPDGYYRVRVTASDELENPETLALDHSAESEPFLLDNHAPTVDGLRYAGGRVIGTARDALGPISALEYAIDGEDWKPMNPRDALFDTRVEAFELQLPKLDKGPHVIAVRASDARNNQATSEIWIEVK
ncbi:MAG: hypothetical protein OXT09_36380 [Myxococcales bacterium]|nr:hypothetical protein [Myxococcales bacterium]